MKNLYIIGNGFDIYHGLDTSYQSFAKYLSEEDWEVYELILTYYYLPDLAQNNVSDDEYDEWARFEIALADLDYKQILDDNSGLIANIGDPEFRSRDWHTFQIEMELIIEKLTDRLISVFKSFILDVIYPKSIKNVEIKLLKESLFLNFNYTDTLERYYGIGGNNICHIHEKARLNNKIILGHGTNPDNFKEKKVKPPTGLSDEELEQWNEYMSEQSDYSYESAKDEILSYYTKTFKNTKLIIKSKSSFFENLENIENVFVLGHSISSVDIEYFKSVFSEIKPNSKWYVSYYSELEKQKHFKTLTSLGINKDNINQIRIEELKNIISA